VVERRRPEFIVKLRIVLFETEFDFGLMR